MEKAIDEGLRDGFEEALAQRCDGYDEPQERCPMRPKDGCACLAVRWRKLPWFKRILSRKPQRPCSNAVLETLIAEAVDDAISFRANPKRSARGE